MSTNHNLRKDLLDYLEKETQESIDNEDDSENEEEKIYRSDHDTQGPVPRSERNLSARIGTRGAIRSPTWVTAEEINLKAVCMPPARMNVRQEMTFKVESKLE
ncbi:hypothetical protein DBV15_11071 [Temnothorax longispinosus]|uniref:Uncharacterized protein n=1 Tax=Temnothorax longispinosus TaxID=300112 RepID=A0A4S2KU87_9HYME|nr:hypothetical protein DBV15_11071 [Temnothorax longispinosus]